jgi:hypothetical protein
MVESGTTGGTFGKSPEPGEPKSRLGLSVPDVMIRVDFVWRVAYRYAPFRVGGTPHVQPRLHTNHIAPPCRSTPFHRSDERTLASLSRRWCGGHKICRASIKREHRVQCALVNPSHKSSDDDVGRDGRRRISPILLSGTAVHAHCIATLMRQGAGRRASFSQVVLIRQSGPFLTGDKWTAIPEQCDRR